MAAKIHNRALKNLLASIGTTLKCALWNGGTLNPDHVFVASIDGTEVSTTGYASGFGGSGRKPLANVSFSQDDTNDLGKMVCDNFSWSSIGTAAGPQVTKAVVYVPGTSDADSVVFAQYDCSPAINLNGSNLTLTINASGLAALTG